MSSGKLTVKPSDKNKTFSFNLCDESRMSINIGKQWVISFPEPKHLLFINSLARKIKKEVKIGIENVKYPAEWIVNENELMSLIINNNEIVMSKNMKVSCSLTSTQTFFQIFLNSLAIIDCKEEQISEPKTYDFTFDVVLWNNKGEEVFRKHESINIRFSEIHTIPNIKLIITNEEVTFSGDLAVETIGYLALSNDSQLSYFPDIDCRVFFSAWNCKDKLPLNNFYLDIAKLPLTMLDNRNPNEFEIHQIQSRKTGKPASQLIKIPIKADFTKLGNPYDVETKSYELKVSVNYNHSNDKNKKAQLPTLNNEFKLHRNPAKAELRIILINEHGKGENKINLNDTVTLAKTHYLPGSTLQFWHKIHFRNQSEHGIPGSGIVIKNINHEIKFLPEDLCEIIYSKRQSSTLSVFNIRGVNLDELQSGIIIPSTKNDGKEIEFGFDSDSIKEAFHFTGKEKNYNIEVQMNLVFEYWEQDNEIIDIDSLPESERKTFKATFILPIYQEPYPEWLGVDFGTSAIVSQYGDKILDLHFEKNKLFNLAIQDNNIDSYEIGTPFLSSNIIFQNNAQINNNSPLSQLLKENNTKIPYNSLALCLSPTTEQEDANVRYILPCLKLMVGYDILPNINNYQNFRFYTNTNGEILRSALHNAVEGESNYSSLAYVNNIFEEIYKELFVYFINPCIDSNSSKMNKLVLTIPNTYSPIHLKKLRNIIKNSFNHLNIRDIRFVSESDSVACYYQKNWDSINRRYERKNIEDLKKKEYILVYDMGAGTLDVTFLVKEFNDNKVNITVLGKIGIGKAGNYLDFIIAQILSKKIPALRPYCNPNEIIDADRLKPARKLKDFIKYELKPVLNTDSSVTLESSKYRILNIKNDTSISIQQDIIKNKEYNAFIHECTVEFMDNFFNFFDFKHNEVKIDTVILSGRSSKLKSIREGLMVAVKNWTGNESFYIDMAELNEINSSFDKAKTVVVEGALAYANFFSDEDSKVRFYCDNIMASYGVIFNDINGAIVYCELLNPRSEEPINKHILDGIIIKEYKTEPVEADLSTTEKMKLIQTFSSNTATDWESGNREYITEMASYAVGGFHNRAHVLLSIEVNHENFMVLTINNARTEYLSTSKIDLNNKSNIRSLWPVITSIN